MQTQNKLAKNQNLTDIRGLLRKVDSLTERADGLRRTAKELINKDPNVADLTRRLNHMMSRMGELCSDMPVVLKDAHIQSTLVLNGHTNSRGLEFTLPMWRHSIFTERLNRKKLSPVLRKFGFSLSEAQRPDCIVVLHDRANGVNLYLTQEKY